MKRINKGFFGLTLGLSLYLLPASAMATINLPFSTTYDCAEQDQNDAGWVTCDGISKELDSHPSGCPEAITTSANYSSGEGGRGQRHWMNSGTNSNSGNLAYSFSQVSELFVRWYVRFESGVDLGSSSSPHKILYFNGTGCGHGGGCYFAISDSTIRLTNAGNNFTNGNTWGWTDMMGGSTADGNWHWFEAHVTTGGVAQLYVDGTLRLDRSDVSYGSSGFSKFSLPSNGDFDHSGCKAEDIDEVAIQTTGPIGAFGGASPSASILFTEDFEDANVASRGWYDNTTVSLSTTEHVIGSAASLQYRWLPGARQPINGAALRKAFTSSDAVYVSYWVKYSSNYTGSNRPYHPHEFYLLTDQNSNFNNLAYTYLTAYIEQNEGVPSLAIQDGQNIDETKISVDLTATTEARAVAGCNGTLPDGYVNLSCYLAGPGEHWNAKEWKAPGVYFSDTPGPTYKNEWHHVEAFFKLNSLQNGKGVADGILQYWYDGQLVIDRTNVIMRTAQHPTMKFNQFIIAPYIGDSSPVDQSFWIDDLMLATSRSTSDTTPAPPSQLSVQ